MAEYLQKEKDGGITFQYEKQERGILIMGCNGEQEQELLVPGTIEGIPVTAIAPYAWKEFRALKRIWLPDTVTRLGSHCFYNCRSLEEVHLSDAITEVEDGAFKNCEALQHIHMNRLTNKGTCMKCIMNELNTQLEFTLYYVREEQKVVILFPRYVYDYEANVEARIINQITYGTGVHYRECVRNGEDIDYAGYDRIFEMAVHNDEERVLCRIARNRLLYPLQLAPEARKNYYNYVMKHLEMQLEECMEREDTDTIRALGELGLYTGENIDGLLQQAHGAGNIPATTCLMEYKQKLAKDSLSERFLL